MRVVSLVPSATETLLAWGVEPLAVTRFCEQGTRFPTVGGTKDPDVASISALSPDVVVMCDQENRLEDAYALRDAGIEVHAIHITDVAHVGDEMVRLALALGLDPARGHACVAPERDVTEGLDVGRRVFVPIWRKPWMSISDDTYAGSILRVLGLVNITGASFERYPTLADEQILAESADLVIAPSEPYPFTKRQLPELERFGRVCFVDGKDLFWWGVRTPHAVTQLQSAIA